MDELAIRDGRWARKSVTPALRHRPEIVLAEAGHSIRHRAAFSARTAPSLPRDLGELRDEDRSWGSWSASDVRYLDPQDAYAHARDAGYRLDRPFFSERTSSSHERLAWTAARGLLEQTSPGLWVEHPGPNRLRIQGRVDAVIPYFVVPDVDGFRPHLVSQLWIVREPDAQTVRWIALEISNEKHQEAWLRRRDEEHAQQLLESGVEVVRVAAWWLRVDPFRVIVEFWRKIGLISSRHELRGEERLRSIADYVCDACAEPLCRWDENDIEEVRREYEHFVVHQDCALDL